MAKVVAKISGKEGLQFTGKAIVFDSEELAMHAILDGTVKAGHITPNALALLGRFQ